MEESDEFHTAAVFTPNEGTPTTGSASDVIKVKVKLSLCLTKHHSMKTYWGSGSIAPRILDLGTRWK
jgi:hypothetical protein